MREWLAGLVVGVAGGFLFWVVPTLAIVLIAAIVIPAIALRRLGTALSGALAGIGAVSLIVLTSSVVSCSQFDAGPGQECVQPDLTPWFVAAAAILAAGIGLGLVGLRRRRSREMNEAG